MDLPANYLELSRLIKSNTDPLHAEIERLRAALTEIETKGSTTGYARQALSRIAREALNG